MMIVKRTFYFFFHICAYDGVYALFHFSLLLFRIEFVNVFIESVLHYVWLATYFPFNLGEFFLFPISFARFTLNISLRFFFSFWILNIITYHSHTHSHTDRHNLFLYNICTIHYIKDIKEAKWNVCMCTVARVFMCD